MSEAYFKNGMRDGIRTEWYANGEKQSEIEYREGNKIGLSLKMAIGWHIGRECHIQ